MTRAAFSGRPEVRKKAASPGPNSLSGGSEAQSSSAFLPWTAALPEPLCTESGARVASSLARALRASLPSGGCRPGVGGFAVADAPHGQGSPRRRRRSAGSLNVTAERATAAPDPFCACFRPYPRFRCRDTRGDGPLDAAERHCLLAGLVDGVVELVEPHPSPVDAVVGDQPVLERAWKLCAKNRAMASLLCTTASSRSGHRASTAGVSSTPSCA